MSSLTLLVFGNIHAAELAFFKLRCLAKKLYSLLINIVRRIKNLENLIVQDHSSASFPKHTGL
jgi:predicted GNAT superfamily acetyltransferase